MGHKRRGSSRSKSATRVGLARYRKEQWHRWLETVDDPAGWEGTYEAWQQHAEEMAERLRRAGLEVIFVDLDADEFVQWCRSRGYKNDSESRSRYAAEQIGNIPPPSVADLQNPLNVEYRTRNVE